MECIEWLEIQSLLLSIWNGSMSFLASYDTNLDYLQYCSNATSSAEMVNGRLQFFKDAIKEI